MSLGSAAAGPGKVRALLERRAFFWSVALTMAVIGASQQLRSWLTPDAAWYLYAARRMIDGARLYVDVVDINPPLIILLSAPAAAIGKWLGVSDIQVFRLLVLLLAGGSLLAAARLLRRLFGGDERATFNAVLLLWLFALLLLTREDFGQREHLLLAMVVPYVTVSVLRASGVRPPRGLAAACGVLAGVGMALKPHFALLWLGVEGYLWWRARRGPPWHRAESVAAALVPVAYGGAVLLVMPAYLDVVRVVGGSYSAYLSNSPLAILMHEPWAALVVAALLAALALRPADERVSHLVNLLAVVAGALLVAALAQQKGWRYHLYPAFATATVLLGMLAVVPLRDGASAGTRAYVVLARALTAFVVVVVCAGAARQVLSPNERRYDPYPEFRELLALVGGREARSNTGLLVMSNNLRSAFPLVNYSRATWSARWNAVWLLGAVYGPELMAGRAPAYRDRGAMTGAERYLNDALAEDVARVRPSLLIVERPLTGRGVSPVRRLDYLAYFRRDERLARELAAFRKVKDVGDYEVYERVVTGGRE